MRRQTDCVMLQADITGQSGFCVFHKFDSQALIHCHIHPLLRNQFFNKQDLQCSENFQSPL